MELLLIRHALPVRRELLEGPADPELSEQGCAQAERLADYLAAEAIDAIYASPLQRAVQTAGPLAERFALPILQDERLAEYDRESNEYVPMEELKATNDPRWQQALDDDWSDRPESKDQFMSRVNAAFDEIVASHRGQTVAVVCHGGVINGYLSGVLATAASSGFFYPNYTSIHRVIASSRGHRQILTINETAHLRGTGLPIGMYGK